MPTPHHPKPYRRAGLAALTAALILTVAGCGGRGHSQAGGHSSTTSTSAASETTTPTTTTAPTPTESSTTVQGPSGPPADYPAAQATPPSLAGAYPTGTTVNLVTVIKTLTTYEDWVWSHPNPTLVGNYELATGNAYATEVKDLTQFQQERLHAAPTPTELDFVKVTIEPRPQPALANGQPRLLDGHQWFIGGTITVVYDATPTPMLTASGTPSGQQFNPPKVGKVAESISLVQGTDGQFRIEDTLSLNPPGGIQQLERG